MKRLRPLCLIVIVGLSACDGGTWDSPTAPEVIGPAFGKVELPAFEPPTECPAASCIVPPNLLVRERKAPAWASHEFSGEAWQEAELVIVAADPKATTVKAWLNGATVLLPSLFPRSGSDEVRIPLTLAEENAFLLRMSGPPGTQVVFWIEGTEAEPGGSGGGASDVTFLLTDAVVGLGADMNAVCAAEFGEDFGIADWTEVVEEMDDGASREDVLSATSAWILWNGTGLVPGSIFTPDRHYEISTVGWNGTTTVSYGTDVFWLNLSTFDQRVLCIGPST